MSDEPPPPGAEESEPPVPGVDSPAVATDASASAYTSHADGYPPQPAAYGNYSTAAGYSDYYNYYYPGYTPPAGYGQYGYDYNYPAASAPADPYAAPIVDGSAAALAGAATAPNVTTAAAATAAVHPNAVPPPAAPPTAPPAAPPAAPPVAPPAAPPPPPDKKESAPVQVIPLPEPVPASPPPPSDPISPAPAAAPQVEASASNAASAAIPGPTQEALTELQQRMQELMEKQKQQTTATKVTVPVRKPGIAVPTLRGAKLAIGSNTAATAPAKQSSLTLPDSTDPRPTPAAKQTNAKQTSTKLTNAKQTIITTPSSVPNMSNTSGPKGLTISAPSTIGGALAKKAADARRAPSPEDSPPPRRAPRRSPSPGRRSPNAGPERNRSPPEWKGRSYRRRRDDSPDGLPPVRGREAEVIVRRRDDARASPSYDSRDRSASPGPVPRRKRSVSPPSGDYRRRGSGSPPHRDLSGSPRGGYYRGRGRGGGGYRDDYYDEWREDGYYRGRGRASFRGRARGYYPRRGRGRFNGYQDRFESYDPDDRYDPERSYSDDRYEPEDRYTPDDGGYRGRGRGLYESRGRGRNGYGTGRGGYDERYDSGYARGRGRRYDPRGDAYPDERGSARQPREESYSSPASSDQESDRKSESSTPSPSPSPSPPPRPPPATKPAPKPSYNFEEEFADIDKIDFSLVGGKTSGTVDSKPSSSVPISTPALPAAAVAANGQAAAALFSAPSMTASSAEKKMYDKDSGPRAEMAGAKPNGAGSLFPVTEWASASNKSKGAAGGSLSKHSKEEDPGSPIYGTNDRDVSAGSGSDMEVSKKHKKKHKKHKKKHKKRKRSDAAEDEDVLEDDRDVKASESKRDKKRKRPPAYFQHDDRDATPPRPGARSGQVRLGCLEPQWAAAAYQICSRAVMV